MEKCSSTRKVRSREALWTTSELELLADAIVQLGHRVSIKALAKRLHAIFLSLGSSKRTQCAVEVAARSLLIARRFVLDLEECQHSWVLWLNLPVSRRNEISRDCHKGYRSKLLRMNLKIFSTLDLVYADRYDAHFEDTGVSIATENSSDQDDDTSVGDGASTPATTSELGQEEVETNHQSALMRTAQAQSELIGRVHTDAVESRVKQWKSLCGSLLETANNEDQHKPSNTLELLLQKQAIDVKESMAMFNAQSEMTTNLLATMLRDRVQHDDGGLK